MSNLPLAILVLNLHDPLAETRTRTTEWLEGKKVTVASDGIILPSAWWTPP